MSQSKQRYSITEKSGSWLYHDAVPHEVLILRQNFDSLADERGVDPESLNQSGEIFHVQFCVDGTVESTSAGFHSLAEAVAYAESNAPTPIHWDGAGKK